MDLFRNAKVVRLLTYDSKYLTASEDTRSVSLQPKWSTDQVSNANANWTVEHITTQDGKHKLEFWSCYQKTLQITSMMGTVRQMKKGKQAWFPGWEATSSPGSNNSLRLWTCKCFLEARLSLKLIFESAATAAHYDDDDYRFDWFVEVVESMDDHPHKSVHKSVVQKPVAQKPIVQKPVVQKPVVQKPYLNGSWSPLLDQCPCNTNSVVVNYHVDSGRWAPAPPPISHFNSGQNVNGSGTQTNGDINVQYEVTTGRDINVRFK